MSEIIQKIEHRITHYYIFMTLCLTSNDCEAFYFPSI